MVVMQHWSPELLSKPRPVPMTRPPRTRLSLPSREVGRESIEDAYTWFILACNPAVPIDVDTSVLREAFQTPPKSGGKSFSTWTLFQLIAQFQSKQIKTWGELALKLGVEPPDQDKGESSQKIQQYAVRLKRWMHSMHVDAFFEYLLSNPHPYWTEIPRTTDPVAEGGRDGVAAEDDMALRSLLPHIRPRRGRKRPDEKSQSGSPSGPRPKAVVGGPANNGEAAPEQQLLDFWASPHTNARGNDYLFSPHDSFSRGTMDLNHTTGVSQWMHAEFASTPINANAYAPAIPRVAAAHTLWSEQHRCVTEDAQFQLTSAPSTASKQSKRHGAKVVSSAWRAGGPGGSGKTRGRPPMKRKNNSGYHAEAEGYQSKNEELSPFSRFQTLPGSSSSPPSTLGHTTPQMGSSSAPTAIMTLGSIPPEAKVATCVDVSSANMELPAFGLSLDATEDQGQEGMHRQLSLQLPENMRGEVRLGTPYSQHDGSQGSIVGISDGSPVNAPPVAGQSSVYSSHGLAEPTQPMYLPYHHQQQRHLDHDLQYQTGHQVSATLSFHRATSVPAQDFAGPFDPPPEIHRHIPPQSPLNFSTTGVVAYEDTTDRTNLDTIESLLAYSLLSASWHDINGTNIPACDIDEAVTIASQLIETVRKGATSQEAFVSNISTLVGTTFLKNPDGHTVRVYRVENDHDDEKYTRVYDIHWDLRLGDVRGGFSLRETVNLKQSCLGKPDVDTACQDSTSRQVGGQEEAASRPAEANFQEPHYGLIQGHSEVNSVPNDGHGREDEAAWWRRRYEALLSCVQEQNAEMSEMRRRGVLSVALRPITSAAAGKQPGTCSYSRKRSKH